MRKSQSWLWKTIQVTLCVLIPVPVVFASPIDLSKFNLINSVDAYGLVTDGFVSTPSGLYPGDPASLDLTGGNTGSGLAGETDFVWTAPTDGTVQFQYSYTSCTPPNADPASQACDTPGGDFGGYLTDINLIQLTDTDTGGVTSPVTFMVSAGQVFGWYVGTADNTGEPGTLTLSAISFTSTGGGSETPEPGGFSLGVTAAMMAAACLGMKKLGMKHKLKWRKV